MSADEQIALLTEIRDLLREQAVLFKEQQVIANQQWKEQQETVNQQWSEQLALYSRSEKHAGRLGGAWYALLFALIFVIVVLAFK